MYNQENLKELLNNFITLVSKEYKISAAYLFGSYAKNTMKSYSDIDVVLISDNFEGSRFNDRKKLNKFLLETSTSIEIHPFRTEDFDSSNPFVAEILKSGIKLI